MEIKLIDNATQGVKFEVTLKLLEEMAHCIHDCSWVSGEEIAAYMKSCVSDCNYEPEEWSFDGKGKTSKERGLIEVSK